MLKKISTIALFLFSCLLSCSSQQSVEPENPIVEPNQAFKGGYIRIGEEKELGLDHLFRDLKGTEFRWYSGQEAIAQTDAPMILIKAPEKPGHWRISCDRLFRNRLQETLHFDFVVYRQVVILKADDLVYAAHTIFPSNWNRYFELLDSMGIKGSAGIIGKSLEDAPQVYYEKIKRLHRQGNIEFWNHGYSHELNMRNVNGEACHEFKNSGYAFQELHLLRSQELAKEKLGFPFRTFGAPGNAIDAHTALLIEQNDDIRIWFYGMEGVEKSILNRSPQCEIEYPTHKPDFQKFLKYYNPAEPFLTLQFHPTSWSENHFRDFRKALFYLQEQGVTFMKPTEFARTFYPELVQDLPDAAFSL